MGNGLVKLSPDVSEALSHGRAVVALESTIISHGMLSHSFANNICCLFKFSVSANKFWWHKHMLVERNVVLISSLS